MARLKESASSAQSRSLYEQIWDRAAESLLRVQSSAWGEEDLYPKSELERPYRETIARCEAGFPLVIGRWQVPRDMPVRWLAWAFQLWPDGRIEPAGK